MREYKCALLLNSNTSSCLNYRPIKVTLRRKIIFYLFNKINFYSHFTIFATFRSFSLLTPFLKDILRHDISIFFNLHVYSDLNKYVH